MTENTQIGNLYNSHHISLPVVSKAISFSVVIVLNGFYSNTTTGYCHLSYGNTPLSQLSEP